MLSGVSNFQQNPAGSSHDLTMTLAYSPASQLTSRAASNDAYAWTGAPPGTTSYGAATGLNQYPSIDSDPYSYDANGNLTVGGGRTRAYDVENRLIAITGAQNLSLGYDPLGRLREISTGVGSTEFLYSGDALVAEYNAMGSLTQRYVHGAGIDEPLVSYAGTGTTSRSWLLADERGSIIATTTAAGAAMPYAYGSYGEPSNWAGPRFRFTGQIALPEAELYHYKARAYDPVLGRFLQTDPVGYRDHMNLCTCVGNDPINMLDPYGEDRWGFNIKASLAIGILGANISISSNYDTESKELGGSITVGYRTGAKLSADIEAYVEPSSVLGNMAAAQSSVLAEAKARLKVPIGYVEASGEVGYGAEVSTQGKSRGVFVDGTLGASLGPVSVDAKTGRASVGVGGGVGISIGADIGVSGNLSIGDSDDLKILTPQYDYDYQLRGSSWCRPFGGVLNLSPFFMVD